MFSFKQWCEQQENPKPWRAKKREILDFWGNLPDNSPIVPVKIAPPHSRSTYPYDGIRVTGSNHFINAVMSKLKDLKNYEAENSKLNLIYKQQIDKRSQLPLPNSFVFYVQVKEKGNSGATS